MLLLSIILLLCFLIRDLPNVTSMVSMPVANNRNQPISKLQDHSETDRILNDKAQNDIMPQKMELRPSRPKDNSKGTGLTLDQCYGGIGRWLRSSSEKNKNPKKERKCYCVCCGKPILNAPSVTLKNLGKGPEKCCVHVQAGGSDGCANLISGEDAGQMTGGAAGDKNISLLKITHTRSETTRRRVLEPGRDTVASTVQRYDGTKGERRVVDRPVKTAPIRDYKCICQLCCGEFCPRPLYSCCGECLIFSVGGCVWCVDRACRACCGLICKGLEKCFSCCC